MVKNGDIFYSPSEPDIHYRVIRVRPNKPFGGMIEYYDPRNKSKHEYAGKDFERYILSGSFRIKRRVS